MEAFKYTWTWGTRYSQKETLSFSACSVVFGSVLNSKSVKTKAETLREPQKVTAKKHCQVLKTSFPLKPSKNFFALREKMVPKTSFSPWKPRKFSARFTRNRLHVSVTLRNTQNLNILYHFTGWLWGKTQYMYSTTSIKFSNSNQKLHVHIFYSRRWLKYHQPTLWAPTHEPFTLGLTHTVQNSSLQTNGGAQVHVWTWGTRYSENFTLEKSHFTLENTSKFSSRSRENGTKNLI